MLVDRFKITTHIGMLPVDFTKNQCFLVDFDRSYSYYKVLVRASCLVQSKLQKLRFDQKLYSPGFKLKPGSKLEPLKARPKFFKLN